MIKEIEFEFETQKRRDGMDNGAAASYLHCPNVFKGRRLSEVGQGTFKGLQPLSHLRHEVLDALLLETEVGQSVFGLVVHVLCMGQFLLQVRLQNLSRSQETTCQLGRTLRVRQGDVICGTVLVWRLLVYLIKLFTLFDIN